tara:strand:+ start:339 stop:743 length:405 start_codon:yes stop_codon:yes gene_type:complete
MKINKLKLVHIFVEELMDVYSDLQHSQSEDSDGGQKVTRAEIWEMLIDFICELAPRLEGALLARNSLDPVSKLRWSMIKLLAQELSKLPDELERVRSVDSAQGEIVTKREAIEVITIILRSAIPKLIQQAKSEL